jgi:hypothetical protein
MMKRIRKNGQEEAVGFVLIIILVVVIAVVFLVISVKKNFERVQSKDVESFLQASMKYSTDCYSSPEIRYTLKEMFAACRINEKCLDDRMACDVLNSTFSSILKASWRPSKESPSKAYMFKSLQNNKTILKLTEGNCTGAKMGSSMLIPSDDAGDIHIELDICY